MSVAAMTMDDQRPLMNNFDSMKQYDHITNAGGPSSSVVGGVAVGAPTSGPASPTPSTSEEQQQQHHHHHHHHASHHHHHHHQSHQLKQPTSTMQSQQQQQQQQQPLIAFDAATTAPPVVAEQRQRLLEEEIQNLKLEQTRLSQQCADAQRREKILLRRLANKEQEFQDYVSQIAEYKAAQAPGPAALRSALLDPAVNLLFEKLKKELKATKAKLEETQNELSAWKFTPDSNTGKRLMAKCRLLYQENEELGKMTSNGRLAKLETELAMQKSFSEEVKKSQSELDDFLQELDEDVEGMQSTILFLQQELKTTRDRIQVLEKENSQLKSGEASSENTTDAADAQQQLQRLAINAGNNNIVNNVNTTADIINNIIKNQIPANAVAANTNVNTNVISNASNNVSNQIEPIEEKMCPRTIQNILLTPPRSTPSEFVNGLEEAKPDIASIEATDDGSSKSGSINNSNNSVVIKLSRTISTTPRKRSYDESEATIENTAGSVAALVVTAPRTLPPKKSKLRITPARRASAQSLEMTTEIEKAGLLVPSVIAVNTTNIQQDMVALPAHAANTPFVDNAVAGMANEESGAVIIPPDDEVISNITGGAVTVALQRIMTRRRSLRNQPNGDSTH